MPEFLIICNKRPLCMNMAKVGKQVWTVALKALD